MPADNPDKIYYCTQCRVETTLARVCPKCHRKTTLRPRDQSSGRAGGARRRASSAQVPTAGGSKGRGLYLGGAVATVAVVGVVWWGFAQWRRAPASKKAGPAAARSFGPAASEPSNRVFGAARPGGRVAPPPPPRVCGAAYRASIHYRFHQPAPPAAGKTGMGRPGMGRPATGKAGMGRPAAGKAGMARPRPAPRPRRKGPEAIEHRHTFLLAQRRGRWTYVPLTFEIRITLGGHTVTALKLDRTGGLLPDRRTGRPRQVGYHDSLQPGLRISDLIGRVQADLEPDPRGGLKVTRQRLSGRMVSQWLQTSVGLASFLHPRPPRASARVFEDRRLPPGSIAAGLKSLVRRFRLQPAKAPAGSLVTYRVDAPALSMRRAKSTTLVQGLVALAPGEPLPRKAELALDKLPRKGGGTQAVTLRLDHLGRRCNTDK